MAEDGSLADAADSPLVLPEESVVHLLHPIDASPEERAAWGTIFADYQLLQPFPQLGRPTFLRLPEETGTSITRFAKMEVPGKILLGVMEKAGWIRGSMDYGKELHSWHRTLEGHSMSASVSPSINLDDLEALHTVTLNTGTPMEGLSPRIFSELVRPLEAIRR